MKWISTEFEDIVTKKGKREKGMLLLKLKQTMEFIYDQGINKNIAKTSVYKNGVKYKQATTTL